MSVRLSTSVLDWAETDGACGSDELGLFDAMIASDVLYEPQFAPAIAALLEARLLPGGLILLADDTKRPYGERHREALLERLSCTQDGSFEVLWRRPQQVAWDGKNSVVETILMQRQTQID